MKLPFLHEQPAPVEHTARDRFEQIAAEARFALENPGVSYRASLIAVENLAQKAIKERL